MLRGVDEVSTSPDFTMGYYEQPQLWGKETTALEVEERINETISMIPKDCFSILDVGCGDGTILNRLVLQYSKVCGLDVSREALRYVKSEKVNGSIESLPFSDRSFDLVLGCEVLEHLPLRVYPKGIKELQRVAAKYILVSVPNNEKLSKNRVTCPQCGCVFHSARHLRSFNQGTVTKLFSQFGLQTLKPCRPMVRRYPRMLIRVARFLKLLPGRPSLTPLCPQCGYFFGSARGHRVSSHSETKVVPYLIIQLLRPLVRYLARPRRTGDWLIGLYKRI